jgi:hypothetical protein
MIEALKLQRQEVIEQRGFAVVDVAHDCDYGGTQRQCCVILHRKHAPVLLHLYASIYIRSSCIHTDRHSHSHSHRQTQTQTSEHTDTDTDTDTNTKHKTQDTATQILHREAIGQDGFQTVFHDD